MSKGTETTRWDTDTQAYHAGQEWDLDNFVEDFSVTINGLGTPTAALEAAKGAISLIDHYPPADFEPALTDLAKFIWPGAWEENKDRLLLGNGASELIDLVVRSCPTGEFYAPGPTDTQYKEYERSATTAGGRTVVEAGDRSANLVCMVNPTNPTGDYMNVEEIKDYIEASVPDGATVVVDESMQLWLGPEWREDSLTSQGAWVASLKESRGITLYITHSWTKIWSCCGLRLGSVVTPTPNERTELKRIQVPWSVNIMGLYFLSAVVKDEDFLQQTWEKTPLWRAATVAHIEEKFPNWTCHGKDFLSWVWIDTKSQSICEQAVALARAAGVPVRPGKYGYERPTFLRIAVREEKHRAVLWEAWRELSTVGN